MSLNPSQKKIAEKTDGLMVVDAGPGTGKTHTIVDRYINILCKEDVLPKDVLLMTFTNNAATEMEERIKNEMCSDDVLEKHPEMKEKSKLVLTKTFDAFCLGVVMDSPELVSRFFRMNDVTLTRSAMMIDNKTVKIEYFNRFMDDFLEEYGEEYGDWGIVASQDYDSLYSTIQKLMSKGIVPLRNGWFGKDVDRELNGDTELVFELMKSKNTPRPRSESPMASIIKGCDSNNYFNLPEIIDSKLEDETLMEAAADNREGLFDFVRAVYYEYIRSSIRDNRLTFGLVSIFAFVLLYDNKNVRERNMFRYVMIDEFQDTNANQLMIAMMILSEPNLCVVGDWKQGIYGFRFVSIENITDFQNRLKTLRRFLNEDYERVMFSLDDIEDVEELPLDVNYRSSKEIIDKAFECLYLPGTKSEIVDTEAIREDVTEISPGRTDIGDDTCVRYVKTDNKNMEPQAVIDAIHDYVAEGRYIIHYMENKEFKTRPVRYSDIAVICRKTAHCRAVMEACTAAGIPAFLHGDVSIMSTREGKLLLAWLRYINNERDLRGYVPILSDMNYTLSEISSMKDKQIPFPYEITSLREELRNKRRRITELMTLIFNYYGLDNDITQAIITTISSAHRNSLLTISDIIRLIDEDIEKGTSYNVENSLDDEAVNIMTMHKSKGLEFPVVIVPFVDSRVTPLFPHGEPGFLFTDKLGMRASRIVGHFDGYPKICKSWKTDLAKASIDNDYSEERRLMFVALSRAKQYMTLICGDGPSNFMKLLSGESYEDIPSTEASEFVKVEKNLEKPDISGYKPRKIKLGVHDILDFGENGTSNMGEKSDEVCGKGMEYGTTIHKKAYEIVRGFDVDLTEYEELSRISKIIHDLRSRGAKVRGEMECGLPVPDLDVTLRGAIDLLAVFDDHVEIHDYKTDVSKDFENEYRLQLSVYAHAAGAFYGKPVKCVIDYVSRDEKVEFDPLPLADIQERVRAHISQ